MTAQTGHIGYLMVVWELHFIGRDYLGSITHITDSEGNLVAEYSYDAWGRLRDPDTQELYGSGKVPDLLLWRGFTGHEWLPWFGLYNMNAYWDASCRPTPTSRCPTTRRTSTATFTPSTTHSPTPTRAASSGT